MDSSDEEGELKDSQVELPDVDPETNEKADDSESCSLWTEQCAALQRGNAELQKQLADSNARVSELERGHKAAIEAVELQCEQLQLQYRRDCEKEMEDFKQKCRQVVAEVQRDKAEELQLEVAEAREQQDEGVHRQLHKLREEKDEEMLRQIAIVKQEAALELAEVFKKKDDAIEAIRREKDEEMQQQLAKAKEEAEAQLAEAYEKSDEAIAACKGAAKARVTAVEAQCRELRREKCEVLKEVTKLRREIEILQARQAPLAARVAPTAAVKDVAELRNMRESQASIIQEMPGAKECLDAQIAPTVAPKEISKLRNMIEEIRGSEVSLCGQITPLAADQVQPHMEPHERDLVATNEDAHGSENPSWASGSSQVRDAALCSVSRVGVAEHMNICDATVNTATAHDMPSPDGAQGTPGCQKRKLHGGQDNKGPAKRVCFNTTASADVPGGGSLPSGATATLSAATAVAAASKAQVLQNPAQVQEQVQPDALVRDACHLVAELTNRWSGKAVNLCGKAIIAPMKSWCLTDLKSWQWQQCHIWPKRQSSIEFTSGAVLGPPPSGKDSAAHLVVVSGQQGTTIEGGRDTFASGRIELGRDTALIFDHSCRGVKIRDLEIHGGVVVCSGAGCTVDFTTVKFFNSTLVATAGAQVTLNNVCKFQQNEAAAAASIITSGISTSVKLSLGSINGGHLGVLAIDGSKVELESLSVTNLTGTAAVCSGNSSHMLVSKCSFSCCLNGLLVCYAGEVDLIDGEISKAESGIKIDGSGSKCTMGGAAFSNPLVYGVVVSNGGVLVGIGCRSVADGTDSQAIAYSIHGANSSVALTKCLIQGHRVGVALKENCEAVLSELSVGGCRVKDLEVLSGAGALLKDCTLSALAVKGEGTRAIVEGCTMTYGGSLKDATMELEGASEYEACLTVGDKASAFLEKCCFGTETSPGCKTNLTDRLAAIRVTGTDTNLHAQSAVISTGFHNGLHVQSSAEAALQHCIISKCSSMGVLVEGEHTVLNMVNTRIVGSQAVGVCARHGTKVNLIECSVSQSAREGVAVNGPQSQFVATNCKFQGNQGGGVLVEGTDVHVDLTKCKMHKNNKFTFSDRRPGTVALRAGACGLLPDVEPPVKFRKDACIATREYVCAVAAEVQRHGPCTIKHLKQVPRAANAMKLENVISRFECFQKRKRGQIFLTDKR